jgi:hypothetical protein
MEKQLINELIELIKSDHPTLLSLKQLAIKKQRYDLAAELRKIEVEVYPTTASNSFNIEKEIIDKNGDNILTMEELIETLNGIVEMLKLLQLNKPIGPK